MAEITSLTLALVEFDPVYLACGKRIFGVDETVPPGVYVLTFRAAWTDGTHGIKGTVMVWEDKNPKTGHVQKRARFCFPASVKIERKNYK